MDPNTKYSFSVRAINVQGGSKFSQEKIKELKGLLDISVNFQVNIDDCGGNLCQNEGETDNPTAPMDSNGLIGIISGAIVILLVVVVGALGVVQSKRRNAGRERTRYRGVFNSRQSGNVPRTDSLSLLDLEPKQDTNLI